MQAVESIRFGKQVLKSIAREIGANLVALHLYPFGFLENDGEAIHHSYATENEYPVLLVHGIHHNNSAFLHMKANMEKLGWRNIYTLNYSTRHGSLLKMVDDLSQKIDEIRTKTQSPRVDIVAHSLGGIVARYYMTLGEGRGRVARLITLGTPHQGNKLSFLLRAFSSGSLYSDLGMTSYVLKNLKKTSLPRGSSITSIYSKLDLTMWPKTTCRVEGLPTEAFHNIELEWEGHIGLLYSPSVFEAIVRSLGRSEATQTLKS